MQDLGKKSVRNIIYDILTERSEDFSWTCLTPDYYQDFEDDNEDETIEELPSSPTLTTLMNIRNLCDTIQNNIVNSGTTDDSFLMMGLMEVENKLKEFNDTLNSLMDYNNNQAMESEPQILTGDIILQ